MRFLHCRPIILRCFQLSTSQEGMYTCMYLLTVVHLSRDRLSKESGEREREVMSILSPHRQRVRDDFTLLAERIKRSHRKSIVSHYDNRSKIEFLKPPPSLSLCQDMADDLNSVFVAYSTAQTPGHTPLKPVLSTGVVYSMAPLFSIVSPRRT